jgi:hypothetical protein
MGALASLKGRRIILVFYWDDNNRLKPRTTVTTLATRGAGAHLIETGSARRQRPPRYKARRRALPLGLGGVGAMDARMPHVWWREPGSTCHSVKCVKTRALYT